MRRDRLRVALELILGVALLALVGIVVRQVRQLAEARKQRAADLESLRHLQEILRQRSLPNAPAEAEEPAPEGYSRAALARRDATIAQLNSELVDARAAMAQLQTELVQANDERDKAIADAGERHQKDQADWQSRLESLQQDLEAAQAGLEASRRRVTELEATNDKLRSESGEDSKHSVELARVLASLQDLDRRRDAYLTSIIRRYRDITNQFRGMSGMLDTSHDPNSGAFSGAALDRIQNAIAQADDDLRQLNELNDQARQLEKKLLKK